MLVFALLFAVPQIIEQIQRSEAANSFFLQILSSGTANNRANTDFRSCQFVSLKISKGLNSAKRTHMDTTKEVCHPSDITVVVTFSHFVSIIYCVDSGESNSRPPGWQVGVLTVEP